MSDLAIVVSLLVALGGIITALSSRRKTSAEAAQVITDSAMTLLAPLNKRIEALEEQTASQEKKISKLERGIAILTRQLRKIGVTPDWTLEEDKLNLKK